MSAPSLPPPVGPSHDAADAADGCRETPEWGLILGICMGVAGSIGINVSQNIQSAGISKLPESKRDKPHKSKLWLMGMGLFTIFSLVNFGASAFAPISVLMPIESLQFATNVAYHRVVNKTHISPRMFIGVALSLVGTVLSVTFGAQSEGCLSVSEFKRLWIGLPWLVYLIGSLLVAALSQRGHVWYCRQLKAGKKPWAHKLMRPILFTMSSALAGGALMIVHSKVFSTLLSLIFLGRVSVFADWLLYMELVIVVGCGVLWVFRQTQGLSLYDPLIILPLMVGIYILTGGIAGGIYFDEFSRLHLGVAGIWSWPLYLSGILMVMVGLYLIADAGTHEQARVTNLIDPEHLLRSGTNARRMSMAMAIQSVVDVEKRQALIDLSKEREAQILRLFENGPNFLAQATPQHMPAPIAVAHVYRMLHAIHHDANESNESGKSIAPTATPWERELSRRMKADLEGQGAATPIAAPSEDADGEAAAVELPPSSYPSMPPNRNPMHATALAASNESDGRVECWTESEGTRCVTG